MIKTTVIKEMSIDELEKTIQELECLGYERHHTGNCGEYCRTDRMELYYKISPRYGACWCIRVRKPNTTHSLIHYFTKKGE